MKIKYFRYMVRCFVLFVVILCSASAFSQTFFDTVLEKDWTGKGTLMNREATFTMSWTRVLNDRFYQLEFSNNTENFRFEAIGYYQLVGPDSVAGTWFDVRGYTFPLQGNVTNTQLTINWGSPETEMGKTVYSLPEDGSIEVLDYVEKGGTMVQFGQAVYRDSKD